MKEMEIDRKKMEDQQNKKKTDGGKTGGRDK